MTIQDDYQAIRTGTALMVARDRARISVSGRDRASYLQGLLTNDIQALTPGTGCYAAWLTAQGRMTTDMHVFESGDMILLDVPAATRESVLERLDQFIFSEDVQVGDLTASLGQVTLHGPRAAAAIEQVAGLQGLDEWPQYRNARTRFADSPIVLARLDQLGVTGFVAYVDVESESALIAGLEAAGARRIGDEAATAARVEAGYPLYGVDMDADIIPLEAGIEARALSMTKGCYVGQEVIIRVLHRGHGRVVRRLVGLKLSSPALPPRGTRIAAGSRDVGFITSAASSSRFGSIALGYVHRDFVEAGTPVDVDGTAAIVSALPFA
jgi:folate-binding protein YgfZ